MTNQKTLTLHTRLYQYVRNWRSSRVGARQLGAIPVCKSSLKPSCLAPTKSLFTLILLLTLSLTLRPHPAQAQTAPATLTLTNDTGQPICAIAISPVEAEDWGDNWLNEAEGETVPPGETATFEVEAGAYDLAVVDCEGKTLLVRQAVTLTDETIVAVTEDVPTDPVEQCALGMQLYREGRWEEASPLLEAGFANREGADFVEPVDEGWCASALGRIHVEEGEIDKAMAIYQVALTIAKNNGNNLLESVVVNSIGDIHNIQRQYYEAITSYLRGLQIAKEIGDRKIEGTILNQLGMIYAAQSRYAKALESYEQAILVTREVGNRLTEGAILNNIGEVYYIQGQHAKALTSYEEVLSIAQEIDDRELEGAALNSISAVYFSQGEYDEALSRLQQSLTIAQELGDLVTEITLIRNMGDNYAAQRRYDDALNTYQQALDIAREVGDLGREGAALNSIGEIFDIQGQKMQALDIYQQALTIFRQINDRLGEGNALHDIANIYALQGRYAEALEVYQQALNIRREVGDRPGEGVTLNAIGGVYGVLGRYVEALKIYQQALKIRREIDHRLGEGVTLSNMGVIYAHQGEYIESLKSHQQALDIAREIGDELGEVYALGNMGDIYTSQERYAEALDAYQQALTISREIGDSKSESDILDSIGEFQLRQGNIEALDNLQRALSLRREIGDRIGESKTLSRIGNFYYNQGDYVETLENLQQALEILDQIRATAGSDEARTAFIAQYADTYNATVALHYNLNQPEDAFHIAERGRARTFLDGLATGQVQLEDNAAAELLAQEQELYVRRQAVQDSLAQARAQEPLDEEWLADLETELAEIEAAYAEVQADIRARGDQLADLVPGRNNNVLTVEQVQGYLDAETTLVSYYVLDEATLVFLLTADSFEVIELELTREQAANQVQRLRDAFASRQADISQDVGQELYDLLLAPLADKLSTPHLALVPHGPLHYLPFAALADGSGRYLLETHSLVTLPSASSLKFLATNSEIEAEAGADAPFILGNPTLPEAVDLPSLQAAAQEAEAIAALYNTDPLLGPAATESAVRAQANGAGILHLAAHGEYNTANPLYSTLYLAADDSHDGRLETHEVYSLDLSQTDLVVLSACETQVDDLMKQTELAVSVGDEIVGLTRAFMFAGTPTVIATLWQVEDRSSGLLMERFHHNLQAGLGKAEALRQAQLSLLEEERYAAPYYWSAFVLSGDGGDAGMQESGPSTSSGFGAGGLWLVVGVILVVVVAGGVWWRRQVTIEK